MKIEVWADVVCPWCGLGDHRLRAALAQFEHAARVDVVHRSFELDPHAEEGVSVPAREMLAARGFEPEQVAAMTARIEQLAASEDLTPYHVADAMVGSTALVHELLAHATAAGAGDRAWHTVFQAYFGKRRDIFTLDGLVDLAGSLEIDPAEARTVLTDRRHRARVVADREAATRLGVRGVPFFVVDDQVTLSGAQPADDLLDLIRRVWAEAVSAQPADPRA